MKALYLLLVLFSNIQAGGNVQYRRGNSLQPYVPASPSKTKALVKGCLLHKEFTEKFASKLDGETLQKKFTNGKLLGKGSFGEVKEISWGGEKVAVKRMEIPTHSSEIKAQAREIEFIESTKAFNGSMEFLGCLETNANLYYVTEKLYKDLIDPEVLIIHKKKDPLTRLKLYSQIVSKFKKLHALDITHQDIKPANLMVKDKAANDFRIIDFGMGSFAGEYLMGGTPLFNSPEKIKNGYLAKPYYDVYALALTIAVIESTSQHIFRGVSAYCVKTDMSQFCFDNLLNNIEHALNKTGMSNFFVIIRNALTESKKMTMADFERDINKLISANEVKNVAIVDEQELEDLNESKRNAEKYKNDPVKAREAALGYLKKDNLYEKNPKLYDKVYRPKISDEQKKPEPAPLRKKTAVVSDPKKRNVAPEKDVKQAAAKDDYDGYVEGLKKKREEQENIYRQALKNLEEENIRLKNEIKQRQQELAQEIIVRGRDMKEHHRGRKDSYDPRKNNNANLKLSYNNYPKKNIYDKQYIDDWLDNNAKVYGGDYLGKYDANRLGGYKYDPEKYYDMLRYPGYYRRII